MHPAASGLSPGSSRTCDEGAYLDMLAVLSLGKVTLSSLDPEVPLRYDPSFLESPFDRRFRDTLRFAKHRRIRKAYGGAIGGPRIGVGRGPSLVLEAEYFIELAHDGYGQDRP
ncbi:hypothetical protein MKX08_005182 [Trichoderma sp. CBMAI-0020]|nr:hypothetical protein MKX08_005182 [Trichoderma sp. CBMAI-0020]